ncbi:hypothetical protein MT418_000675 [Batrachochytrium dendrobatidis]
MATTTTIELMIPPIPQTPEPTQPGTAIRLSLRDQNPALWEPSERLNYRYRQQQQSEAAMGPDERTPRALHFPQRPYQNQRSPRLDGLQTAGIRSHTPVMINVSTQTAIRPSGEYYHGYYINAHDGGPSEYLKYTYGLTQAEIRQAREPKLIGTTPWVWQLEEVSLDALDRRKQFLADNPTEGYVARTPVYSPYAEDARLMWNRCTLGLAPKQSHSELVAEALNIELSKASGTWAESKDVFRKNKTTGRIRGPSAVPTGSDRRFVSSTDPLPPKKVPKAVVHYRPVGTACSRIVDDIIRRSGVEDTFDIALRKQLLANYNKAVEDADPLMYQKAIPIKAYYTSCKPSLACAQPFLKHSDRNVQKSATIDSPSAVSGQLSCGKRKDEEMPSLELHAVTIQQTDTPTTRGGVTGPKVESAATESVMNTVVGASSTQQPKPLSLFMLSHPGVYSKKRAAAMIQTAEEINRFGRELAEEVEREKYEISRLMKPRERGRRQPLADLVESPSKPVQPLSLLCHDQDCQLPSLHQSMPDSILALPTGPAINTTQVSTLTTNILLQSDSNRMISSTRFTTIDSTRTDYPLSDNVTQVSDLPQKPKPCSGTSVSISPAVAILVTAALNSYLPDHIPPSTQSKQTIAQQQTLDNTTRIDDRNLLRSYHRPPTLLSLLPTLPESHISKKSDCASAQQSVTPTARVHLFSRVNPTAIASDATASDMAIGPSTSDTGSAKLGRRCYEKSSQTSHFQHVYQDQHKQPILKHTVSKTSNTRASHAHVPRCHASVSKQAVHFGNVYVATIVPFNQNYHALDDNGSLNHNSPSVVPLDDYKIATQKNLKNSKVVVSQETKKACEARLRASFFTKYFVGGPEVDTITQTMLDTPLSNESSMTRTEIMHAHLQRSQPAPIQIQWGESDARRKLQEHYVQATKENHHVQEKLERQRLIAAQFQSPPTAPLQRPIQHTTNNLASDTAAIQNLHPMLNAQNNQPLNAPLYVCRNEPLQHVADIPQAVGNSTMNIQQPRSDVAHPDMMGKTCAYHPPPILQHKHHHNHGQHIDQHQNHCPALQWSSLVSPMQVLFSNQDVPYMSSSKGKRRQVLHHHDTHSANYSPVKVVRDGFGNADRRNSARSYTVADSIKCLAAAIMAQEQNKKANCDFFRLPTKSSILHVEHYQNMLTPREINDRYFNGNSIESQFEAMGEFDPRLRCSNSNISPNQKNLPRWYTVPDCQEEIEFEDGELDASSDISREFMEVAREPVVQPITFNLPLRLFSLVFRRQSVANIERNWTHWKDDCSSNKCHMCSSRFTLFIRRHHCRICGHLFCNTCTLYRAPVNKNGGYDQLGEQVRVCSTCHSNLCQTDGAE